MEIQIKRKKFLMSKMSKFFRQSFDEEIIIYLIKNITWFHYKFSRLWCKNTLYDFSNGRAFIISEMKNPKRYLCWEVVTAAIM